MSKATEELLPCPFCGESDMRFKPELCVDSSEGHDRALYVVECPGCGASGPPSHGPEELALTRWNHRAALDGL